MKDFSTQDQSVNIIKFPLSESSVDALKDIVLSTLDCQEILLEKKGDSAYLHISNAFKHFIPCISRHLEGDFESRISNLKDNFKQVLDYFSDSYFGIFEDRITYILPPEHREKLIDDDFKFRISAIKRNFRKDFGQLIMDYLHTFDYELALLQDELHDLEELRELEELEELDEDLDLVFDEDWDEEF